MKDASRSVKIHISEFDGYLVHHFASEKLLRLLGDQTLASCLTALFLVSALDTFQIRVVVFSRLFFLMQRHDSDVKPVGNNESILFFVSSQVNKLKLVTQGNRRASTRINHAPKLAATPLTACHSAPNRCGVCAYAALQPSKSVVAQELLSNH